MVFTIYAWTLNALSGVILKVKLSYLMVSSVVGFYSSPFFTGILPRAKDTNLTQVPDLYASPADDFTQLALMLFCFISDHCKQCVSAHPQLSTASLFTHNRYGEIYESFELYTIFKRIIGSNVEFISDKVFVSHDLLYY